MAKLTDRQRKQIIAEYVGGGISQRELAERYHVTQKTISMILNTEELRQKVSHKKEENTLSMLEYLDSRKDTAQALMEKILAMSEQDIAKANLRDKMGALKILSEIFTAGKSERRDDGVTQIVVVTEDASEADDETGD